MTISDEIALMWIPQNLLIVEVNISSGNGLVPTGNRQLPKRQCWPIYLLPYGVIRPQLMPEKARIVIKWDIFNP